MKQVDDPHELKEGDLILTLYQVGKIHKDGSATVYACGFKDIKLTASQLRHSFIVSTGK